MKLNGDCVSVMDNSCICVVFITGCVKEYMGRMASINTHIQNVQLRCYDSRGIFSEFHPQHSTGFKCMIYGIVSRSFGYTYKLRMSIFVVWFL